MSLSLSLFLSIELQQLERAPPRPTTGTRVVAARPWRTNRRSLPFSKLRLTRRLGADPWGQARCCMQSALQARRRGPGWPRLRRRSSTRTESGRTPRSGCQPATRTSLGRSERQALSFHCASTAFLAKTPPLPCASTAQRPASSASLATPLLSYSFLPPAVPRAPPPAAAPGCASHSLPAAPRERVWRGATMW